MHSPDVTWIDGLPEGCEILSRIDRQRSDESPPHRHPHGEVYVLRSGHISSVSDDARWMIPAGQAYWVPPGAPHGGGTANASGVRVYLSADLTRDHCPATPVAFSTTPLVLALLDRWGEDAAHGLARRPIDGHMVALLASEMERSLARPVILPMPAHPLMRRVMADWAGECEERIGLDGLAGRCCMSRRSFTRQFRSETGLSPGAWMQAARVVRGCQLMASGISVTETAFLLGYESASSFFTLCRRLTGLNPSVLARRA